MKKRDLTKTIISFVVIVVLAVFIVNINKVISPKIANTVKVDITGRAVVDATDYAKCFSDYGESPGTVVFVHSNSCPHCNNMKPIIKELENQGYTFYWAESSDTKARDIVSDCFSDILGRYVPQFICPKTGKEQTGAMTKLQLKEFADSCI